MSYLVVQCGVISTCEYVRNSELRVVLFRIVLRTTALYSTMYKYVSVAVNRRVSIEKDINLPGSRHSNILRSVCVDYVTVT